MEKQDQIEIIKPILMESLAIFVILLLMKHSSVKNPVYAKNACLGCHSHKLNDNNVTIFKAMSQNQDSLECIKCHMPEVSGGAEKINKKTRGHHASHKFLGIHDREFRKKGVDINITASNNMLYITLLNKMPHPLIIQPARAKYLKIELKRDGKVIWSNYKKSPKEDKQAYFAYREDKQAYFAYSFKRNGKKIIVPSTATSVQIHNLNAKEKKTLQYNLKDLKKDDIVEVTLYVQLAS